jgi:hypothetical protein
LTVASIAVAGAVSAGPPVHERFHEGSTEIIDDYCGVEGLTVRSDVVLDGKILIQSGQHAGFKQHFNGTSVDTSLANGRAITGKFNILEKALHATDNGDGTNTVLFLGTGNEGTYGPDGKAIARNPGQIRFELLVDHNGTPNDPSDDEVLAFLGLVKESTGRTDDFCAAVVPVLTG